MESMLIATEGARQKYSEEKDKYRQRVVNSAANEQEEMNSLVVMLSLNKGQKSEMLNKLLQEETAQKAAFTKLQHMKDSQTQRLTQEIKMVELELCKLSRLEQERKQETQEWHTGLLETQRVQLVELLRQLSRAKEERRQELDQRMLEMQQAKQQDEIDFWLVQYQRLLDKMPERLDKKRNPLDAQVDKVLTLADAEDFRPHFVRNRIDWPTLCSMGDSDLARIGVYAAGIRHKIIDNVNALFKTGDQTPSAPPKEQEPSAPSEEMAPSAPPEGSTVTVARVCNECCICMQSEVRFKFCYYLNKVAPVGDPK
ncbi:E3 ubiquitin-protein ligase lrsam1 [Cichlidogyrus casuarinus]|uniref:E3 ubiquitin-protein ligase lrsam1 n=1 Tax=Cichlidogyrus casuarinus TaxID=1844966 RepID=A0ABD2Q595_9PLAT